MKVKKTSLWIGITLIVIALVVIFPIEKTDFLGDLVYTFFTSLIGLIVIIYAIGGSSFFKIMGFLLASIMVSMFCWALFERGGWGASIAVVWGGIPSGLTAGILFLMGNYYLQLNEKKTYKYIKQLLFYFIILLIVSILFRYGGDWYFKIFES